MGEEILTIHGLADYLRIDEKTAYRMAQGGELPGFKVRRQWRFRRADIDVWIESRKKSTAAAVKPGTPSAEAQAAAIATDRAPARKIGRQ